MSNIYIQEPPSKGKLLLITSVGDIDIELWSKEAPKACRNFVQLCMEGYYDGLIFHRVVKNFIVQGGDPTGTGTGGESIYGAPFKDEFHSRLRFVRRGLVAMANTGQHDNGSQFFFTMDMTPELQNKHTIFGKVVGPTLYNMLKLQEVETDEDERPLYPHKIIRAEILFNPFEDIVPRMIKKTKKEKEDDRKNKSKSKATKNFSLLSFGEEAEEDEEQTFKASKKFNGKSKSSHDLIDDPNLSSVSVVDLADDEEVPVKRQALEEPNAEAQAMLVEDVKQKLKKEITSEAPKIKNEEPAMEKIKKTKSEEIRSETKKLKRELKAAKKKDEAAKKQVPVEEGEEDKKSAKEENKEERTDFLETFKKERQKYKNLKKMQSKKGEIREAQTMALLTKFQTSLASAQQLSTGHSDSEEDEAKDEEIAEDANDLSWMKHVLRFDKDRKRKVLDANIYELDRFDVFDPRNPLTQRRREASAKKPMQK